jgi:hypothetical protein
LRNDGLRAQTGGDPNVLIKLKAVHLWPLASGNEGFRLLGWSMTAASPSVTAEARAAAERARDAFMRVCKTSSPTEPRRNPAIRRKTFNQSVDYSGRERDIKPYG